MITAAVYLADQIAVTKHVELLGSLRLDSFDTDYEAINAMGMVTPLDKQDVTLNWRGGVVVHPVELTSVYVVVGSSTNPSAEAGTLSEATASLDPEKNVIYELGAKADLLGQRLNLGGSAFRLAKTNARIPGPDPLLQPQILAGRQRVAGLQPGRRRRHPPQPEADRQLHLPALEHPPAQQRLPGRPGAAQHAPAQPGPVDHLFAVVPAGAGRRRHLPGRHRRQQPGQRHDSR